VNTKCILALTLAALVLTAPVPALARPGFGYVGGGIGLSFINTQVSDLDSNDLTLDGNEFAYKFFAGYRYRFVGVEGGWQNFGKVQGEGSTPDAYVQPSAWDAFAVFNLRIILVDLFGKAGISFTNLETAVDDVNSTDFAWGLGAGIFFGALGVRAEYENFTLEGSDSLGLLTASGVIRW
jgi:hypothetical protein